MKIISRAFLGILILIPLAVVPQKNLKRRGINPVEAAIKLPPKPSPDTIVPLSGQILASGFDKPLRMNREAVFITNNLTKPLSALRLELDYYTTDGRQLHRRQLAISCDIPPGQTRRLEFPSWDRTGQFHYHLTPPPRAVSQATPFDVRITIISATPNPNENSNNSSHEQGTCPAAPYDE